MDVEAAKDRLIEEVDARADMLIEASHRIHDKPELLFEERFAAELLCDALESAGLDVERGAYGLETAFAARAGRDGPTIAILCEYDALPGIGHGCGHNIIASAGLGAGLAAAALADDAGGRVVVLGTPAEEGGGGKIYMGEAGAFDGVDAALMVHPADQDLLEMNVIAIATWEVEYFGEAAHAAAFPHLGRNALDAAVLGYNAVAALRQHIRSNERVHGVFTKAGDKPNIVPDHTVAEWYVRSGTIASLQPLKERVLACLQAGADAAGCRMEQRATCPEYSDLRTNPALADLYGLNAERLGRTPVRRPENGVVGSTDMGNVSYLVPAIHPMIKVAPPGVAIHTKDFARWAQAAEGDRAVLDGAKTMAMTVADLWLRPDVLDAARRAFEADDAIRATTSTGS
ncbi:MAG TPA: M20 family metallopeptidase [Acidimicrobiales bacterium]|jgi:amidohydrolase|nr:M20 family metallopeptidase [Acidimicrobiales bacterium]